MVPLKKPPSTYFRKLATDSGASFSKNSILKSPSVVSKRIIGVPCVVNSLERYLNGAQRNPGVAGIISVRSNAVEAPASEHACNIVRLSVAVLEQQPTAWDQVLRGAVDDALEGFESRRTAGQRECRLGGEVLEGGIVRCYVGRVRDDHIEPSVAHGLEPGTGMPADLHQSQLTRVRHRDGQRPLGNIHAGHPHERPLRGDRQSNGAAARAQVENRQR